MQKTITLLFFLSLSSILVAQANFGTSLHGNRNGKAWWYSADNGGFESITNHAIDGLGCQQCHGATDADGVALGDDYQPGCNDCHPSNSSFSPDSISVNQCYSCHGRQYKERFVLGYSDVHRDDYNMKCWDCHSSNDMHGNGTEYNSLLDVGAIDTDCEDCHNTTEKPLPAEHASKDPHGGKIHCSSCHAQTVLSCYSCHFESMTESHNKRPKQMIHDFVILGNREKDNKVYPMSFQSLTYDGQSFVAIAPAMSHSITKEGRECADCHNNMGAGNTAIQQYNASGKIQFATWNAGDSTLSWLHGIVPFPADYKESWYMDYLKYDGNTEDPVAMSKNWSYIGKNKPDKHQFFFGTPLTKSQMAKIGFDTTLTIVSVDNNEFEGVPSDYTLSQNYPNPFNPTTKIAYSISERSYASLVVYDALGKEIKVLFRGTVNPGNYSAEFNAENLANGIYFATLRTKDFFKTIKMILLK